jgi:3-hydroxyacyl-CoA dehydrogenase
VRRTREATGLADAEASRAALEAARADTAKKSRGLFSPMKIIEAVEGALTLPFDEGMALERKLFLQCIDSPQRAGLIHAFFAEREVLKAPETRSASRARSKRPASSAAAPWARASPWPCSTRACP